MQESPSDAGERNFIASHWRGDYPLAQAFWIHTVLFPGMLFVVTAWCFFSAADSRDGSLVLPFILYATLIVVSVWAMGGTWKSATHHVARGGQATWKNWTLAALAMNVVVLGLSLYPIGFLMMAVSMAKGRI
jgi:hypothetical protein